MLNASLLLMPLWLVATAPGSDTGGRFRAKLSQCRESMSKLTLLTGELRVRK